MSVPIVFHPVSGLKGTQVGNDWNLESQQAYDKLNLLEDPICFQFARTTKDLGIYFLHNVFCMSI